MPPRTRTPIGRRMIIVGAALLAASAGCSADREPPVGSPATTASTPVPTTLETISASDHAALKVGDCVAARPSPIETSCTDASALAKVVGRTSAVPVGADESPLTKCPADTDTIIRIGPDPDSGVTLPPMAPGLGSICLRNLRPPHDGRPGQGGGIMVVGDCVRKTLGGYEEIACDLPTAEYKLSGDDLPCPKGHIELSTPGRYLQRSYCAERL